ncbi:protein Y46B2A.2 [Elysia marginata]|uniref:Protein Y46B2A.2 n=1 Tax=Elysia marginata TaxID=1093978 RepID=A0AAV4GW84_9GAST|nr:protein Y46B2A.2 [Elysia marginata]
MSSTRPTLIARSRRRARATGRESFSHYLGGMNVRCEHCGAFRWKAENKALCCANGQVTLPPLPRTPSLLMKLLSGTDLKAKRFREKFRAYNNALAFASLGVNEEILPPGVYCFKIHGEVHHSIGPLMPDPTVNQRPKFAQIYIYDTDNEIENRTQWNDGLDQEILADLQRLLHVVNPFVKNYKHASDVTASSGDQAGQVKMILKADSSKDGRRYSLPTASEVAVILPNQPFECSHRLMVRQGVNIVLQGGRLFQQYVVDQYSKMKAHRLKFIQHNQSSLRAEI